ncbi:LTA synthase family protein [Lacticaseibacillus brantae]|uniref:Phosphoglycerol transferase alkaline phosphatase superfamily protein n=1 Tax=Lacticaseibacillus brantae DSM 23927 TaxID=1423727 RepID=A0A0R2B0D8_9LACO|nr:LTA synthase family protein [Lacticaseibacillus brantae]KRM72989.1 phosphoglycerol transferase alkaline phosphatase superfamily protein [Lacticaseibacillus brantae DSM 23927]
MNWLKTTRSGFLCVLLVLLWAKTLFAYYIDFSLGATGILQQIILVVNPIGISIALLSLSLYVKAPKRAYLTAIIVYTLSIVLLVANVLYYREFSDFMTINTILGVSKVAQGLGASSLNMVRPSDIIYVFDLLAGLLAYLGFGVFNLVRYIHKQPLRWPHFGLVLDRKPVAFHFPQAITVIGIALFSLNMAISELNRPQLLTRTFDRNYIVKYLGLMPFTVYDGVKTAQTNQVRATADSADMDSVLKYVRSHYAAPNPAYFGQAAGKNVIIIHLESFQQFLIGMKVDGQEVTPFLNSLYRNKNTLSFSNFFNQVGLGKTSDAENMLETSTFGLPTGSLFTSLGTDNTFQGAPAILNQTKGYTTAVFHGGSGGFWNRNNVYKSLGYQYFFDGNFYDHEGGAATEYGIKDKLLFGESIKYLEHLQQPFYTKIITTTNHYPFFITDEDSNFPDAGTDDATINGYFKTAHYLDQALKEFFDYLKASGLDKTSLVMLYGDHYGISNDRNQTLAPLLGKDPANWTSFDNTALQRVPLMFYSPGLKGGIQDQYGGEIDVLPTLLHLLGINSQQYVQFGSDLLSPDHQQLVALRNHNYVTPNYTVLGSKVYANQTGEALMPSEALKKEMTAWQKRVDEELDLSDTVANKNLLRFYVPPDFKPIDPAKVNYLQGLQQMLAEEQTLGNKSTSVFSQHKSKSTVDLYKTDAPEFATDASPLTTYPPAIANRSNTTSTEQTDSSSQAPQ